LRSGPTSKLRGILGVTLTGRHGKVGRAGQHVLLRRQYWDGPNTEIDSALQQALSFYHDLLAMNLKRCFRLAAPCERRRVVVASAEADESKPASISTLVCTEDARLALFADIPQTLQEALTHRVQLIDLIEQRAVIMALTRFPSLLARRTSSGSLTIQSQSQVLRTEPMAEARWTEGVL
jgi:hypothetical protein